MLSFTTSLLTLPLAYLVIACGTAIYNAFFHPLASYPGPKLRAAFYFPDSLSRLRGYHYKEAKRLHDAFGPVVRLAPNALSYSNAQAWKDIYGLKADRTELEKDPGFYKKGQATSIVVSNNADHSRMRRILGHAFSDTSLLAQESILKQYFDLLILKLHEQIDGPGKGRVDILSFYNFLTFDIIGDLALGDSFGSLENGEYHFWIKNIFESIKFIAWIRLADTYPFFGLLLKALQWLSPSLAAKRNVHLKYSTEKAEHRLNRKTDRKDFITYILKHNGDRGMTREEIVANCRTLLAAGSETSATFLAGATYLLLQNQDCLDRLQTEIRSGFSTEDEMTLQAISDTDRLPYLNAVIQESFRCYPSVPTALPRITGPEGAMIDDKFVSANVSVGVHQWSAYRSKSNFASPETFAPERWLEAAPVKYRDDDCDALQPFHLGPRACLGKSLAYFEIRSVLIRMLWNFDIALEEESNNWTHQKEFALWDKQPLWVKVSRRTGK